MKYFLRLVKWSVVFVGVILLKADDELLYSTNYGLGDESWIITLPSPAARKAYLDAKTAVDLQSVICDGKTVVPEVGVGTGYPHRGVVELKEGGIIYQFARGFFESWVSLEAKEGTFFHMKEFRIPKGVKTVEVKYRIRYPDGTASKPLRMLFISSDDKASVFQPQK